MSLNVVSLFSRVERPRSWSNQELAEFYRVQGSLARAGLEVETEQGFSDEGDPWFVFCRADSGDVIIHFARIDGQYVVASPAFGSCVRGRDFRALIEGLMEQHPVVMPREKDRGKFFIHPAALLVALVTTAFFKLYQGDALAAEGRDEHHGSLLPGGSSRGTGASHSTFLALDERAAATLMVAVAVAVAWEQVTNSGDAGQVDTVAVADHSAALLTTPVSPAPSVHASLQDSAPDTNQPAVSVDASASVVHDSPSMLTAPVQPVQPVTPDVNAPPVKLAESAQHPTAQDAPPAPSSTESAATVLRSHRVAEVTPESSSPPPAAEQQHQQHAAAETTSPPATVVGSAAFTEAKAVLGDLLQTHFTASTDPNEQQFVLSLVNTVLNGGATEGVQIGGGLFKMAASPESHPADKTVDTASTSGFSASSGTGPNPDVVDRAILNFMAQHADFLVSKSDHELILYDPGLLTSNIRFAEQESFTFSDGSSIVLIGLPAHYPAGAQFDA